MSRYHSVQLNLSPAQLRSLSQAKTVQLKPAQMEEGPHKVHLTQQQIKRMQKAKAENKGMRLSFSNTQLRYNVKHGSGFFDMLKKGATALIKSDLGQNLISKGKDVGLNLLNKGIDKASNYITQKTGFDTSGIADMAKNTASNIADSTLQKVTQHIAGSGMHGSGPVANVLGSIPLIGSFLGPIARAFGGSISPAQARAIARHAVKAHMQSGGSIRDHLAHDVHMHLIKKRRGGSFRLPG